MSSEINKQISREIIQFSYKQFRKKDIEKMTRETVLNNIVNFIESEVKKAEDHNDDN